MSKKSPPECESSTDSDDELSTSTSKSSTSSFSIVSQREIKKLNEHNVEETDDGNQSDVESEAREEKMVPKPRTRIKSKSRTDEEKSVGRKSSGPSFSTCSSRKSSQLDVNKNDEGMEVRKVKKERHSLCSSRSSTISQHHNELPILKLDQELPQQQINRYENVPGNVSEDEHQNCSEGDHDRQHRSESNHEHISGHASGNEHTEENAPANTSQHFSHQLTVNRSNSFSSSCSSQRAQNINRYDEVPGYEVPDARQMHSHLGVNDIQGRPTPKPRSYANSTQDPAQLDEYSTINKRSSIRRASTRVGDFESKRPKSWNDLNDIEFTHSKVHEGPYKAEGLERWINILLCRGDLTEEDFEARPVAFIDLFKYGSARDKQLIMLGILLAVIAGIGQPIPMLMAGLLTNSLLKYSKYGDQDGFKYEGYNLVAINAALGVLMLVVTFAQYFILRFACQNVVATLRSRFISSILRQDASWFDDKQFGAINSQLNEQINCIKDGIAEKIGLLVRGVSMFLTTLIVAFIFNWKITMVMLLVAPLSCLSMSFMARLISAAAQKHTQWQESSANILQESVLNVRTIQSCNGQWQTVEKFTKFLKKGRTYGILIYFWNGLFDGIFFFILYLFYTLGFCLGAVEEWRGATTAGNVFITTNVLLVGAYFLGVMSPHLMAILKARVAAAVIYKQIERVPEIDCFSTAGADIPHPKGHIEFRDVYFVYPTRKNHAVLKGVSWIAEPGETLAIVGHSGSGKSTSVGLLTRLYDCTSGGIAIDGMDIRQLKIHSLRRMIGIVQQEPVLFNASIYENIALGDISITQAHVEEACRIANAQEFVSNLPQRYNTVIGPGSIQLSGGQKQRIAIARAIVRNPPILLLDEATSALDAESEIHVQMALKEASRGRTTIIIAHRLSTLRDVQKIIVLDNGKVVETGSHEELANQNQGIYASMVKAQQFKNSNSPSFVSGQPSQQQLGINKIYSNSGGDRSELYASTRTACSSVRKISEIKATFPEPNVVYKTLFSGGLIRLYKNCQGNYSKLIFGTIATFLRAFEMPFYVLIMYSAYGIFEHKKDDEDHRYSIMWLGIQAMSLALYCFVTIFGAIALYGWATEQISDNLKIRALKNVLSQDAAYFDKPESSNAKLIQRIGTDSVLIKAATDVRMYQVLNNAICSVVTIIMALAFCWQIALTGLLLYTLLLIALWFLATQLRAGMQRLSEVDESPNLAIEIIENARTIQLLTQETYFLDKFKHQLQKCFDLERKNGFTPDQGLKK